MNNNKTTWDAIVVGTGSAGATVARELAKRKLKVLILEKGSLDLSINIPGMLKRGEMLFIGKGRTLVRGIRTGGTSSLYYGTAFVPTGDIFAKHGIDLTNEIAELKQELPVAPLKDELIGPCAKKIMKSALEIGLPWHKLNKFIYQDLCSSLQLPSEAQWNAIRFIQEAISSGAVLQNNASVSKIITNGQKAFGVEYAIGSESKKAYAAQIVLSAGGLASVNILRNGGIKSLGEGFFCDPLVIVQGVLDGIAAGIETPMATGAIFAKEGYILTDITLPKLVYQLFAAQAFHLHRILDHHRTMAIMVKIRDSIGGQIKQGKIYKDFTAEDKQKMSLGVTKAKEILRHAGAKRIFRTAWTAAHPGGSVRIGETVDSNLKTEFSNLYVCDCSVIPNEWGLPPTFTLLALAKRLAKHLYNQI